MAKVLYAVICIGDVLGVPCNDGKPLEISEKAYKVALMNPDVQWKCPHCRGNAWFDDDTFEESLKLLEAGG